MKFENPGNIRYQVGRTLLDIGLNIEQEDLAGMRNQVRWLRTKASVFLKAKDLKALDEVKPADATPQAAYEAENAKVELILKALQRHKIYAHLDIGIGDASKLALKDDDEDEDQEGAKA